MKHMLFVLPLIFMSACTQHQVIQVHQERPKPIVSTMVKRIPIPLQDRGYRLLTQQLITKQSQFEKFLKSIKRQKAWDKKDNFLNILKTSNIDFSKENLLIYPMEENEGTVIVAVDRPMQLAKHATIHIGKEPSPQIKPNKIYYAVAYLVDKEIQDITFDLGEDNITMSNR